MSLDNYVNLKAAIRSKSHRNDMPDERIDEFIDLAESDMFTQLKLRSMSSRQTAVTSTTDRFLALPDNFLEMRRLTLIINDVHCDVKYLPPESMRVLEVTGRPQHFTVTTQLEFDRIADTAYNIEMALFASLTPLSDANTTNAILTKFPNIYFFGGLYHLYNWADFETQAGKYQSLFDQAISIANQQDLRGRYGPAPVIQRESYSP